MRRSRWLTLTALTSALLATAAPALGVTEPHHQHFGGGPGGVINGPEENGSDDAFAASQWFVGQRAAPNTTVNVHAYASLQSAAAAVPSTPGVWTERTTGDYFTDSSAYHDKTFPYNDRSNTISNSGSGDRYVSGRVAALAAGPDGALFAGVSDGGVWRSRDKGATWQPLTDHAGTMSIGAIAIDAEHGSPYTVYVGTGESNAADSYAGVGVLRSTDGGNHFARIGGGELDGALTFRIVVDPADPSRVYAATTHGLYRFIVGQSKTWQQILNFDAQYAGSNALPTNMRVWNFITDVTLLPSAHGPSRVVAAAGWFGGEPTNGLYVSSDGGNHFSGPSAVGGIPATNQGRITLAPSTGGTKLYAIVQDVQAPEPGTSLGGVFVSASGSPAGPWTLIATSQKLVNSGSAMSPKLIGAGYQPGVQASYNQFLTVDPNNANHVFLGLEEAYQTSDGGAHWTTISPYWNFSLPSCNFSYHPFEGNCNHYQAHADQHAAMIYGGRIYLGNDGGVYAKSVTSKTVGNWTDLNRNLRTLLFYGATAGVGQQGQLIYGGMQDNGTGKFFPKPTAVPDDHGNPLKVNGVQPFGGDGGITLVDPKNPNNVMTEYTGLQTAVTTDGGHSWVRDQPADPGALFIAPIAMDPDNSTHFASGGSYIWDSTAGFGTRSSDWQKVYDLTAGGTLPRVASALATITRGGVTTTWVGWCGPCRASADGTPFSGGITVLSNAGGSWHSVRTFTSNAGEVPARYVSAITIDPSNPQHAWVSLSGYSRDWQIGPRDPGTGHVFEVTATGNGSVVNRSGNLIDAPATSLVRTADGSLVAGTDFGAYVSRNDGQTWMRLGGNLPNVVVDQLSLTPTGQVLAATHGRGVWTIPAP